MQISKQKTPLNAPFLPLRELVLPAKIAVPDLFLRHRRHHGSPVLDTSNWQVDREAWSRLPPDQAGVFVHVLTRLAAGMEVAVGALPLLSRAAAAGQRVYREHYAAIMADTRYIIEACRRYRTEVAQKDNDPVALGGKFEVIFKQVFPARITALEQALTNGASRREQIRAEARLRTVYHVIGEGLGAISAIWGTSAALHELKAPAENSRASMELPGLAILLRDFTLIERRHIAFGLFELGELARKKYLSTVLPLLREFKDTKPVLEQMRAETFGRWGPEFPFTTIDREQLAALAKQRVVGWLRGHVLIRPFIAKRKRLASLGEIV